MAIDRAHTLKKAEKLLRQGRIDQAIAEYEKVVEAYPKDWTTANSLGDLYVRAGQSAQAAGQYVRIAKHLADDGFFSKAAALYKKILKIQPDNEEVQLEWADVAVRQGLLADAKAQLSVVAARRRRRGDDYGADQIAIRIGSLDAADFEAREKAAEVAAALGDTAGAAARYRELAVDLEEKDRLAEALAALREAIRLDPADRDSRARLAKAALADGQLDEARSYLTREVAGDDPALLEWLAAVSLRGGDLEGGLAMVHELLERDPPIPDLTDRLVELSLELAGSQPDVAFACLDLVVDRQVTASEWEVAAAILREFVARAPTQTPALLKLVEVCVDAGLESAMYEAQAQLADAYLAANKGTEACVIAEDLVAREPWESAHLDRFRRALVMQGTPDPDAVIAERLSGESPFTATDPFADPTPPKPEPEEAPGPVGELEPAAGAVPPRDPAFQVTLEGIDLQAILGHSSAEPAAIEPTSGSCAAPEGRPADAEEESPRAEGEPEAQPTSAPALDTVFERMRRDIGRATADGGAQNLALAETYVEMGMIDEAVQALGAAVRSPRHRFLAARMLAQLHKQRGDIPAAIEWMERATQVPAPVPEDGHAVMYELGLTLEAEGEAARALAVFLELQAEAGNYRDLVARIERLARAQTGG